MYDAFSFLHQGCPKNSSIQVTSSQHVIQGPAQLPNLPLLGMSSTSPGPPPPWQCQAGVLFTEETLTLMHGVLLAQAVSSSVNTLLHPQTPTWHARIFDHLLNDAFSNHQEDFAVLSSLDVKNVPLGHLLHYSFFFVCYSFPPVAISFSRAVITIQNLWAVYFEWKIAGKIEDLSWSLDKLMRSGSILEKLSQLGWQERNVQTH